jgi:membrane associated rhomboid family serine protease
MRGESNGVGGEIDGILGFLGVIWGVFLLSIVAPGVDRFGVVPRTPGGLIGIAAMPFLHASFAHLLSNTAPLFILLTLLAGSRARSWAIVARISLSSGLLLWVFGRPAIHIGASALVFGLITFLIASGVLERRPIPLLVSAAVGFLYGGSLLFGVIPGLRSGVSWDGHLCGAVAGLQSAYSLTPGGRRRARAVEAAPRSFENPAL